MQLCYLNLSWSDIGVESPVVRGEAFTLTFPHAELSGISCPAICVVVHRDDERFNFSEEVPVELIYIGVIESKYAVSTFDQRIKVSVFQSPLATNLAKIKGNLPKRSLGHFNRMITALPIERSICQLPPRTSDDVWRFWKAYLKLGER